MIMWIAWATGALLALLAIDRLLLWMEARGWIYWRKVKRKSSLGSGLLGFNAMFDPSTHHLTDAREEQVIEDEDDGDDEAKRKAEDRLD